MTKEEQKIYYQDNKNKIKQRVAQYYIDNEDKIKQWRKQYYIDNKDKIKQRRKQYRLINSNKIKKQWAQYYIDTRPRRIQYNTEYNKNKKLIDINYKISCNLRSRLNSAIKNKQKVGSSVRDLGCTIEEFKQYITNKFTEGMTWSNHGKWHFDHIVPLNMFNLQDREQFLIACNYTNYQPLWAYDNHSKNDFSVLDYRDGFF